MGDESTRQGPLAGVKVIDLTTVLMAPLATLMLAEMGAAVTKVESPAGDTLRDIADPNGSRLGPLFLHANRGKRSVSLDLKSADGREILLRMLKGADCLVYNVRPQAMARLALSYEDVARVNPGILYVGMFGFNQIGPYAARAAYDDLIQGAAGLPWLTMQAGAPAPFYAPTAIADRYCGVYGLSQILAGLFHRERTGEGQRIDVPMFEAFVHMVLSDHLYGRTFGDAGKAGYERLLSPQRRPYRTKDGHICVMVYNDKQWRNFAECIGEAVLFQQDERLRDIGTRTRNIDFAYGLIEQRMLRKTTAEWLDLLEKADIPVMPMHSIESLLLDPQVQASGLVRTVDDPVHGQTSSLQPPSDWSRTPPKGGLPAPELGQHTNAVLRELGFSDREIERLDYEGVIRGSIPRTNSPKSDPT